MLSIGIKNKAVALQYYCSHSPHYEPVDVNTLLYYKEAKDGQW
jgi:pyruvate dehydrogenase complex dehydrogenase (E1) component